MGAAIDDFSLGGSKVETVLVTAKQPIVAAELTKAPKTPVKLQLTYSNHWATFDDADWDVELGYHWVYLVNLGTGTFQLRYMASPN